MNKEQLISEVDNIITESESVIGSFIYSNVLKEVEKEGASKIKYEKLIKKFEKYKKIDFSEVYQKWYSKATAIIKIVMPNRYSEFENLYLPSKTRKEISLLNYTIFDAIRRISNRGGNINPNTAMDLITTQIDILKSIREVLEHRLNEISNLLEFDVFEKEIDSARYLLKNKYLRSAGAICGVIIEKHLTNMLTLAGEKPSKKEPTINDLNDDLYKHQIINTTQYKYLIYLGDIRNKCDHNKKVEQTKDDVEDLINGTEKIIKTY